MLYSHRWRVWIANAGIVGEFVDVDEVLTAKLWMKAPV